MMNYKLHLITSKDDLRPVLTKVNVTKEFIVATNAHVMAAIKTENVFTTEDIERIPEDGFYISAPDWKQLVGCVTIFIKDDNTIEGTKKNGNRVLIYIESKDTVGKYPNWQNVFPTRSQAEDVGRYSINAKLYWELTQALGIDRLYVMDFYGPKKGAVVWPNEDKGETHEYFTKDIGIIMPIMI